MRASAVGLSTGRPPRFRGRFVFVDWSGLCTPELHKLELSFANYLTTEHFEAKVLAFQDCDAARLTVVRLLAAVDARTVHQDLWSV